MNANTKPLSLIVAGLLAALTVTGCSKGNQDAGSSTTTTTSTTSSAPAVGADAMKSVAAGRGDAAHGKTIFTQNCATCHGASGTEGGVGPSLKNEKSRKNTEAAIAWIKNPQPPMPKLYPSPLSEKDVADVAAYVESL